MEKLRLAIIGCGNYMFNSLYPMLKKQPVGLIAICDTDAAKVERFRSFYAVPAAYSDYNEMLGKEKPDAVICATNAAVHYEAAKACLEAGAHVFIEKTPCENAEQAIELARLSKDSGKILAVGFNKRFSTGYALAKDIVCKPEFGEIATYYSKFNTTPYSSNDYLIFNHIIHHVDLARHILGELKDVELRARIFNGRSGGFSVNFTAEGGAVGVIQCASCLNEPYPMERLDISGEGGNVVVDNVRDVKYNRATPNRDKPEFPMLSEGGDCLHWNLSNSLLGNGVYSFLGIETELQDFVNSALNGRPNGDIYLIGSCVGTMRVTDMLREALRKIGG